uniref:Uncharacterized protein n=1 Tax=Romanomermis culicivorax TaxID=13658 RepID=A0A915J470_ROMCU
MLDFLRTKPPPPLRPPSFSASLSTGTLIVTVLCLKSCCIDIKGFSGMKFAFVYHSRRTGTVDIVEQSSFWDGRHTGTVNILAYNQARTAHKRENNRRRYWRFLFRSML